jgi:hypothetical protein
MIMWLTLHEADPVLFSTDPLNFIQDLVKPSRIRPSGVFAFCKATLVSFLENLHAIFQSFRTVTVSVVSATDSSQQTS